MPAGRGHLTVKKKIKTYEKNGINNTSNRYTFFGFLLL